jgi:O-succinylbenzoic acid--CoA ligase
MKLKHSDFHKDFKLNSKAFASVDALLIYAADLSKDTHHFLEDWFSEKEYVIVNTSGSTGAPKAVKLQKAQMQNSAIATGNFFKLKEKTSALLCLPVVYIAGKMMLVRALTLGWHLDVMEADSNPLKENFKAYDFAAMVPLQVENSMDKLSQIKKLIVGGGAVSNALQEKLQYVTTVVFGTYGMTETITHIAVKKLNNFKALLQNVYGQSMHKEYYTTLLKTSIYKDERNCLVIKNTTISDTVIFTNDVVRLISDTQFEWLGRFDNVVNSGGIKLYPERIEEKLGSIIKQRFFVAGCQDDTLGEKLVLIVEGVSSVFDFKKTSISKFEIPKETYFIDHFVETATKKIQRQKTLDLINFN